MWQDFLNLLQLWFVTSKLKEQDVIGHLILDTFEGVPVQNSLPVLPKDVRHQTRLVVLKK